MITGTARTLSCCIFLTCLVLPAQADVLRLYDDSLGNLPGEQEWLAYADNSSLGGNVSQSATTNGVNLITDTAVSAGYSNYLPGVNTLKNASFPTLDRNQGFSLKFELQVNSEAHISPDRAGFSVILLADDMRGIELGFWETEIWAQNDSPIFSHGETAAFDTTLAEVEYEVLVSGDDYLLSADGVPLLSNTLRDYTAFGGAPYDLSNYIFLGDNTSRASASIQLGQISLTAVPEPSSLMLLGIAACCGVHNRRRRNRKT